MLLPGARLTGIRMPHPNSVSSRKMFRHMRRNRRNMTPSRPILSISSSSLTCLIALLHPKRPFLSGGGACFESACLLRGAYTEGFRGRRREKATKKRKETPKE